MMDVYRKLYREGFVLSLPVGVMLYLILNASVFADSRSTFMDQAWWARHSFNNANSLGDWFWIFVLIVALLISTASFYIQVHERQTAPERFFKHNRPSTYGLIAALSIVAELIMRQRDSHDGFFASELWPLYAVWILFALWSWRIVRLTGLPSNT